MLSSSITRSWYTGGVESHLVLHLPPVSPVPLHVEELLLPLSAPYLVAIIKSVNHLLENMGKRRK